jgi:hypothetical protein
MLLGESAEAGKEAIDPAPAAGGSQQICWKREGEEGGERGGSHSGEVAEAAGEAAMADRGGGVEVATKVSAFQREIGGDNDLAAAGRAKDGAVVADAESEGSVAAGKIAANLFDES